MRYDIRRAALRALCTLAAPFAFAASAIAAPVSISTETATFCQDGYPINAAFDGDFSGGSGWAVYGEIGSSQTVAFKAGSNVGAGDQTQLTFQLHMFWSGSHTLGKFRLSATTSGQSTYGQGSTCSDPDPSGSANWTVLHPQSVHSQNGQTLTILGDGTVLASGNNPDGDLVTVVATAPLRGITRRPVVDFPQPLSPTRPRVSPSLMLKLMSSTAFSVRFLPAMRETKSPPRPKCFVRCSTCRSAAFMIVLRQTVAMAWRWQAAKWPGATCCMTGASRRQTSMACGQRGWNLQPCGGSSMLQTVPGIGVR